MLKKYWKFYALGLVVFIVGFSAWWYGMGVLEDYKKKSRVAAEEKKNKIPVAAGAGGVEIQEA